jgi:hypothetical protein
MIKIHFTDAEIKALHYERYHHPHASSGAAQNGGTVSAKAAMATMATMERLTGLKRSENRGREFLKAMGLKLRKLGLVLAKADAEMQEGFKKSRTVNSA